MIEPDKIFTPASEMIAQKEAALLAEREMTNAEPQHIAGYVRGVFTSAKSARTTWDTRFTSIRRRLQGIIDPHKLAALRAAKMPEDYFRLTARKARDVEGWVGDVFNPYQERTWDVVTQESIDLPPDKGQEIDQEISKSLMFQQPQIQELFAQSQQGGQPVDMMAVRNLAMQIAQSPEFQQQVKAASEAKKQEVVSHVRQQEEARCTKVEEKIKDILHEGGYYEALAQCFKDLSELPFCVLKGPILKKERAIETYDDGGAVIVEKIRQKFYRVNPFNYYPCANSKNPQDGPVCELEDFKPSDLQKMIGVKGYKDDVIKKIIRENPNGYREITPSGPEQFRLEKDNSVGYMDTTSCNINSIDFWGDIPGKMLRDWGMSEKEIPDPDISYPANVKMVNSDVYRAILNPDPLGEKPYHVTSFVKSNDSQCGTAPAELGASVENFCMNALRNLVRNIGESAGPVKEIDISKLADGEDPGIYPGKEVLTDTKGMGTPALKFYQANLLASELWTLFKNAKEELDYIIVPSFGSGSLAGKGGGRTSSGLAQIMNSESRNLKIVVGNVDHDLQIPAVEKVFRSIMLFDDDMSLKGGLKFKARGIGAQLVKEGLVVRQLELLKETMNPLDQQIFGIPGRTYLWKDPLKNMGYDIDQAIPNLRQIESTAHVMQPPQQPGAPEQEAAKQGAMMPNGAKTDVSGKPMADYHQ